MSQETKQPLTSAIMLLVILALLIPAGIMTKNKVITLSQSTYKDGIIIKCSYRNDYKSGSRTYTSSYTPVALTTDGETAKGIMYLPQKSWCERLIGTSVPVFVHNSDAKQNRIGSFFQFWFYPFLILILLLAITWPNKDWHKSKLITLLIVLAAIALVKEFSIFNTNRPETNLTTDAGKFDACINKAMNKEGVNSRSELKSLSCSKVPDLSALSNFYSLEKVYIRNDEFNNFHQIPSLPNLKELSVRSSNIQSFDGLDQFSNLTALSLIDIKFSSIKDIPKLKHLRELLIRSNPDLESLAGLEQFELLEKLEVERNNLSDIQTLASLKNLRVIYIMHEPVSDLSALANLNKLEVARFRSLKTNDFSPLYNKPRMRHPGATGVNIPCEEMERWMSSLEPNRRKFMWLPKHCKHLKE